MNADGADELENEVVYMEESAASFRALEWPQGQHRPRPADLRDGPGGKIFGGTPGSAVRNRACGQLNLYKADEDIDYSIDIEEYASQGSEGFKLPSEVHISVSSRSRNVGSSDNVGTPGTSLHRNNCGSQSGDYNELSTPKQSSSQKAVSWTNRKGVLHSEQLDRPARWSTSSASKPISSAVRHKRPLSESRDRAPSAAHTQFSGPATFSTFKKRVLEVKTPGSLDTISFKPSWMRSGNSAAAFGEGLTPVSRHYDEQIEDNVDMSGGDKFEMRAAREFREHESNGGGQYDRIDDLTNSLNPVHDAFYFMGSDSAMDNGSAQYRASLQQGSRGGNDCSESPQKTGKRKLKHYGALLKKVIRTEDGIEARWMNLSRTGALHRNVDPARCDLTDPRCASTRCVDLTVIGVKESTLLQQRYGLELLQVEVVQLCQRAESSTSFERIFPHCICIPTSNVDVPMSRELHDHNQVSVEKECGQIIKPETRLLGIFRSSTIEFLKNASSRQSLLNLTLRIYDYNFVVSSELSCDKNINPMLNQYQSECSTEKSVLGVNGKIMLVGTRIVEIRKHSL